MKRLALFLLACSPAPSASSQEPLLCSRAADGLHCAAWRHSAFAGGEVASRVFDDATGWGESPTRWATLQMVDLDGRGPTTVCGRGADGIECALRSGDGFLPPVWSSQFRDDDGFDQWRYASTLQWIDVDGDGRVDACARGREGVACAHGAGDGSFGIAHLVDGGFFSDARGFASETDGGTLQFGDLDGDGRADLCVRGGDGVYCARSLAGGFTAPTRWSSQFSDADGWGALAASRSLDLVDVDGDGRADLCGADSSGVLCALSTGAALGVAQMWTPELTLLGDQPGAPQFGDLDGDGRADVCGRIGAELRCLLSRGDAFEAPFAVDAGPIVTGELELVDLDGDGRSEVCWRQPGGLTCADGRRPGRTSLAALGGGEALGPGIRHAARRRVEPLLNPTARENLLPGTPGWWVPMPQQAMSHEIEAFTNAASYGAGEHVSVFASAARDGDPIRWMLLRTGWYGGAGARRIADGRFAGRHQPLPPQSTLTEAARCDWSPSFSVRLPPTAVSGVYLLRLDNLRTGSSFLTTFVVRDDSRQADLMMQRSDLTDAAYNNWDGQNNLSSWYFGSPILSLDRPMRTPYSLGFDMSYSAGYFTYEYSLVRFLERQGYDVKYVSDLDTHVRPPDGAKAFLVAGHDEYWSDAMRDHVEAARDAGMHLGFFGADMVDGEITFLDPRTFEVPAPGTLTKQTWAGKKIDPTRPPHDNPSDTLTGTHLGDWCGAVHPDCLKTGDGQPFARLSESDDFTLEAHHSHPVLRGIPHHKLRHSVGYEYEVPLASGLPFTTTVLAEARAVGARGQHPVMLAYQTAGGARVFNAGSMHFNHGLDSWAGRAAFRLSGGEAPCHLTQPDCFDDESPFVQQLAVNVLLDFGARPAMPISSVTLGEACDWNQPSPGCLAKP